tara:strand:- start:559 stop:1311 length:753 start_codon:yes stop_codon:yes gene_type:complete
MKNYREFMSEKDALHGSKYGHGIKGKDEKKQADAFDRNIKKYKDNPDDKSAFEPTAIDKKVMKKREKGEMPPAPKSKHTEGKGPCWDGYKQVGMKNKGGKQVPNCVPEESDLQKVARETLQDIQELSDKTLKSYIEKAKDDPKRAEGVKLAKSKLQSDLNESPDKALANKAKESGEPLGDLKKVYKKGLAAYASGHRPGMTQHQWAMARVNSYIKGGPARKVDAHVRKEQAKRKLKVKARNVKADVGVRG